MFFNIARSIAGFVLFAGLMLVFGLAGALSFAIVAGLTFLVQGQPDVAILCGVAALIIFAAMRGALGVITYGSDRLYS